MKKIKAFTMMEILIISILITVGLFTVRGAIDHARKTNEHVKQSVIGNQLATEGAEILYQKRNTNFLEYYYGSGNKEVVYLNKCRLSQNIKNCFKNVSPDNCNNFDDLILARGYYYIDTSGESNIIKKCNDWDCEDIKKDIYAICLRSGVRVPCPEGHNAGQGDQSRYGKFYRMIEGLGVYDMSENEIGGRYLESEFCNPQNAQEYRFCSRVAREGGGGYSQGGEVEICSTMTNFAEIEGEIARGY